MKVQLGSLVLYPIHHDPGDIMSVRREHRDLSPGIDSVSEFSRLKPYLRVVELPLVRTFVVRSIYIDNHLDSEQVTTARSIDMPQRAIIDRYTVQRLRQERGRLLLVHFSDPTPSQGRAPVGP